MKVTHSAVQKGIRIITVIRGIENPEFKLKVLTSNVRDKKGHYFSCSPLFKSMGSGDSFASFVTYYPDGGGERTWNPKYKDLMENRCIIKDTKVKGTGKEKYWLKAEDLIWFLDTYEAQKDKQREALEQYRDWVNAVIDQLPTAKDVFVVDKFFFKEIEQERDHLDRERDSKILNTFTKTAKMLEIGVKKDLMPFLRKTGVIYKQRGVNLAMEKYIIVGYFKTIEARAGGKADGQLVPQTMVTNKGYLWIKRLWETKK